MEQLKTGQHIPLRSIEKVSEDYAKISHEVAQIIYKKHITEAELKQYEKSLTEGLAKMKELNLEGNKIYKQQGDTSGQEITQ